MDAKSGKGHEVPVMRPDLAGSVLKGGKRDLEVENSRPLHPKFCGQPEEPFPEALSSEPNHRSSFHNQSPQETVGLLSG